MVVERHFYDKEMKSIMAETPLVNGVIHGLVRWWYPNGQQASVTPFENGQAHGLSIHWHRNGQLASVMLHVNGTERPDLLNNKLAQLVIFGKVIYPIFKPSKEWR